MEILTSPESMKAALKSVDVSVGFVPTMGALHAGHKTLIERARKENDVVVVSIFVNPTQFLAGEDLEKYPRKMEADAAICKLAGVDYLFAPGAGAMYGADEPKICAPEVRGYMLEGMTRPGHFSGVLTVVMKLLNIVGATRAYFGKKDAQQLMLIETMVRDYFMDVQIVPVDTVRESDGLALSSRNVYLSKEERTEALKISRSLKRASKLVMQEIRQSDQIRAEMRAVLEPLEPSYVAMVDRSFRPIDKVEIGNTIILVEAVIGETRLIDNIWL